MRAADLSRALRAEAEKLANVRSELRDTNNDAESYTRDDRQCSHLHSRTMADGHGSFTVRSYYSMCCNDQHCEDKSSRVLATVELTATLRDWTPWCAATPPAQEMAQARAEGRPDCAREPP